MKKLIIIFLLLTFALLSALTDDYLISIENDQEIKIDLNIYHITQNHTIAGITKDSEQFLQLNNIKYNIIDTDAWSTRYYIVSHPKQKEFSLDTYLGEIIFNNDNIILIKTDHLDLNKALETRLSVSELKQTELKLRKRLYAPDNLNLRERTDIESLIEDIDPDSIGYVIQSLQDFVTRYTYHENRKQVAEWIQNRFWEVGVEDAVLDSFFYSNIWHYDVVATIPGTLHPDQYIMLGGHHDSIVHFGPDPDPMVAAPGADDNASSVAATIEIARVMMENDYQPESSIRFITFAAEEVGLWGAYYYASVQALEGTDIRMMLNCDMIANNTYAPGEWILDIPMYSGSEYLRDIGVILMDQYTTLNYGNSSLNSSGSDSYAFFVAGFPVSYYFEREFSPYYHSIYDVIDNCDLDYCAEITRLCGAMVSTMETMPTYVSDLIVVDTGTGNSMQMQWSDCPDLDFGHYSIGVGTESGIYDNTYTTTDTFLTINDLTEGQEYYFGIAVIDLDENSSLINQQVGTPASIPGAPGNLDPSPQWIAIDLNWDANSELDIAGYYIYRADSPEGEPAQLNAMPIEENYFHDEEIESGQYYYYTVKAVDLDANLSDPSDQVSARAVSLDSGILVIDDTENGTGTFLHPIDADCDLYFEEVLADFSFDVIDSEDQDLIRLSEFGPYSTVLWHVNDASNTSDILSSAADIASYLEFGGNFAFIGLRPTLQFGYDGDYPATFSEGDYLYDLFNISAADYSQLGRFYFAESLEDNIEDIMVDTLKTPFAFSYHMYNIESIAPDDPGNTVFTYGSLFSDEQPFGVMNGLPVGSWFQNGTFKTAIFSFPLYYMDADDSRDFLNVLLEDYFGEMTGSDDTEVIPSKQRIIMQNYPNPFNPETVISLQLKNKADVQNSSLIIFNIKGQKICDLTELLQNSELIESAVGFSYNVTWDGKDQNGSAVSSGLYFYKFGNDKFSASRKMILIK